MSGDPNKPRWNIGAKIILLCATVLVVGIVGLRVAFLICCTAVHTSSTYGQITFLGDERELDWVSTPDQGLADCELFLQIAGHKAISIHDVTEEYLQTNYSVQESKFLLVSYDKPYFSRCLADSYTEYSGYGACFKFEKGRLVGVHLSFCREKGVKFSNRIDGTYIQLPIKHKDLSAAWGQPDHSESKRVKIQQPAN